MSTSLQSGPVSNAMERGEAAATERELYSDSDETAAGEAGTGKKRKDEVDVEDCCDFLECFSECLDDTEDVADLHLERYPVHDAAPDGAENNEEGDIEDCCCCELLCSVFA